MIKEIINKTNYLISEVRFINLGINVHKSKLEELQELALSGDFLNLRSSLLRPNGDWLKQNKLKLDSLIDDIMSLHSSGILSEPFCIILKDTILTLIINRNQINYKNCYSDFLKPLLDECSPLDITPNNLSGLLNEVGEGYEDLVAAHPKVQSKNISDPDIPKLATKLEEDVQLENLPSAKRQCHTAPWDSPTDQENVLYTHTGNASPDDFLCSDMW